MVHRRLVSYSFSWIPRIGAIDRAAWNALARPLPTPFLEWDWLRLMEDSGSASQQTGWLAQHLTVWSEGRLIAAAPLYIKQHSAGEFVFDHVWAQAAARLEIAYYPKLVGMSPFTPMNGYRFLIAPGENEAALTAAMVAEIDRFCRSRGISGCSFLFVDPVWRQEMLRHGFLSWQHQSFAWQNHGYENFDDYLAIFHSSQRHNIRRELRAMEKQGIEIKTFCGQEIPASFFPRMHAFYMHTNDKFGPWGCRYLTAEFFEGLQPHFRQRLLFTAAFNKDQRDVPLALALLVTKGDQLYGRYWGAAKPFKALHFNACYYAPIQWAIERQIAGFDPGAGGAHKIRRGFMAVPNYSLHRFYDQRLHRLMQLHLDGINRLEQEQIEAINAELPFAAGVKDRLKTPSS